MYMPPTAITMLIMPTDKAMIESCCISEMMRLPKPTQYLYGGGTEWLRSDGFLEAHEQIWIWGKSRCCETEQIDGYGLPENYFPIQCVAMMVDSAM
jgi:hypothetical protein